MDQPALFLESVYDALSEAVRYLGGPKAVGARLWPQKSVADARTLVLHCLSPERHEKFDPEQVLLILRWAREAGYHGAKHWIDDTLGYEPSAPRDPVVERDRAIEAVENATRELARTAEILTKAQAALKPSLRSAA